MVRIVDNSAAAVVAARKGALAGVTEVTLQIETDAKIYAPVHTGNHRRSIGHVITEDGDKISGVVGHQSDYGLYLELGTRHMAAQPHFRPALDKNSGTAAQVIARNVAEQMAVALPKAS